MLQFVASIIVFKLKRLLLLQLHFIDVFFKLLETDKNLLKICSFLIILSVNSNLLLILKFLINLAKNRRIRSYHNILISSRCSSSLMMIHLNIMTNFQRSSYILITTFLLSKINSYKISIANYFSKDIQIIQCNLIKQITIIFIVFIEN